MEGWPAVILGLTLATSVRNGQWMAVRAGSLGGKEVPSGSCCRGQLEGGQGSYEDSGTGKAVVGEEGTQGRGVP